MDSRYRITINIIAPSSDRSEKRERVIVDPLLRGLCEQHIDEKLAEGEIRKILGLVEVLDIPAAALEDTSFGLLMGAVYSYLDNHCIKLYNRFPKRDEIDEYHQILRRRAPEIKSKIAGHIATEKREEREAMADDTGTSKRYADDYHLLLQRRTQEIKAEIEGQTTTQSPANPGVSEDKSKEQTEAYKFRFNSSNRKDTLPINLGIPIQKKKTLLSTTR